MMKKLNYYYDKQADVLYFSKGKPSRKALSQETSDDVILRFNPGLKEIVGFTILNFTKRLKQKSAFVSLPLEMELTPLK